MLLQHNVLNAASSLGIYVSIPQAVGAVATLTRNETSFRQGCGNVSIPQAVGAVATIMEEE